MTRFEACSSAAAAAARAKVVLLSKIREWRRARVLYGTTNPLEFLTVKLVTLKLSLSLSLT